jgi:hypothetical protein
MAGWLGKLFGAGAGELVEKVGGVVERFSEGHLGKKELLLEVEKLAQAQFAETEATVRAELGAKERVLVAELAQGDNFTKRARPSIVYAGLAFILGDLVARYVAHFSGQPIPATMIPDQFWWSWGGITATWAVGRSFEKVGAGNAVSRAVTGMPKLGKLLE